MELKKRFPNLIYILLVIVLLCGCSFDEATSNATSEICAGQQSAVTEVNTKEFQSTTGDIDITNLTEEKSQDTKQEQDVKQVAEKEQQIAEQELAAKVDAMVHNMTLREKVGQLFIVRPDALDMAQNQKQVISANRYGTTTLTYSMMETLKKYPVGGIVMFRKNITSPEQLTSFNKALQNASEIPLFISVDEEGGKVSRLANHSAFDVARYKSAATIGSNGDSQEAFEMGQTIGTYLREYNFNLDFAPVADVHTNPNNPVIGTRSFSSDANTVTQMAGAMADGLRREGILPVFKHFPGHGDTAEDSHKGLATIHKTKEELEACEWLPFKAATDEDCIMMGHIVVPSITGDKIPASLSYDIVTGILRDEMDFQGLIITDSFEMKAIINTYTPGEAAVAAIQAGNDIILSPNGLQEAFEAVVTAVEDGTITEERIDESVKRILRFKSEL